MFDVFRNAFKQADLRKKLLYTLLIIVIFRVGSFIPLPFLDASGLADMVGDGSFLSYLNTMSGGSFFDATIFAMSITPYINSSIIIQLLTVAIPPLERMSKEGETGQKKLAKITRYTTVGLGLLQGVAYYFLLRSYGTLNYTSGFAGWFAAIVIVAMLTSGTALIMWLGERINERGIGNGISIILFASILSRGPQALSKLISWWNLGETKYYILVPCVIILFVAMITFIVWMTNAERRIPVQYAKRQVGRKIYGGQSSFIPIKVNMSGVMPVIFASSLMSIPGTIASFVNASSGFWYTLSNIFSYNSWFYAILYFLLIIGFNYFYVAITYNPIEIANNIRKNNGAIPGIRPGRPTSDFIKVVIHRITLVGAIFLGIIAIFPIIFSQVFGMNIALGGTSILIIVGVALETMRTLESQMTMRHHKGFLE